MGLLEDAQSCVEKSVAWLSATQDDQGRWMGALRSNCCIWYAAGLTLLGEGPDSPVIADICEYLESCAGPEGGFGPYPGEPATALETSMALPLLQWARRDPVVISRALECLRKSGPAYRDPGTQFFRWLFEPENRGAILADRGPNSLLQHVLLVASRVHPTERWVLSRKFPGFYRPPGALEREVGALLMRALTFPSPSHLETAARVSPQPIGFDSMLLITASLRRLAGDTSAAAARLTDFALRRRRRFSGEADLYEWIYLIVADLFFTGAFGLAKDRERAANEFRAIRYEGNGWLRGARSSMNIFDTALTLLALKAIGVTEDRALVRNARDFLIAARRPADGLWSWAYDGCEGAHRGQPDSDDTGAASMALACFGGTAASTVASLSSMQEKNGSFITFGRDVPRPNWCWVSNTSRSLQGLLAVGVDRKDLRIERAVQWLRSQQLPDGSWVDGWCARYIYGTAMAVEALMKAGAGANDPAIRRAIDWLLKQQNSDGGWGEDWYGGRARSTPEHTGLAVYALCLAAENARQAIESGTQWLVSAQRNDGTWDASYFVDFGFGVGFADSQMPVVWSLHGLGNAIRVLSPTKSRF